MEQQASGSTNAGIALDYRLGGRVRWMRRDVGHLTKGQRSGVIDSLYRGTDGVTADVVLDEPIIHKAFHSAGRDYPQTETHRICAAVTELLPYDDIDELLDALRALTFAGRTSGGVAGRDEQLCAALDAAEKLLERYAPAMPEPVPAA